MKQDEIIEIARQAGLVKRHDCQEWVCNTNDIEAFANLVAQHERERCAKLRDELHFYFFDKTATIGKAELVASVEQALDDYAKLIRTGDV
jgi:hypothetical protein